MTERTLLERIVVDPKIMLGKPVIKGTRLPVEIVVEKVAYGATPDDLRKDYPFLKEDDIRAALLYAVESIRFTNIPKKKRVESVRRHREWQKLLDKDRFIKEIFGG